MTKCNQCGSGAVETRLLAEFFASDLLGAPFPVFVEEAVTESYCTECGKVLGHSIPNPEELSAVVALLRAADPIKLNGQEIRFLRRTMGWKANRLAKELRITPEALSKYENGRAAIGEVYEQLLRALVFIKHNDSAPAIDMEIDVFLNMKVVSVRDASTSMDMCIRRLTPEQKKTDKPRAKWKHEIKVAA